MYLLQKPAICTIKDHEIADSQIANTFYDQILQFRTRIDEEEILVFKFRDIFFWW